MLTGRPDLSQGGLALEDTGFGGGYGGRWGLVEVAPPATPPPSSTNLPHPPQPPSRTHPNGLLAEPQRARHIASHERHGRSPPDVRPPQPARPATRRDRGRERPAFRRGTARVLRAALVRGAGRGYPQRAAAAHECGRVGDAR